GHRGDAQLALAPARLRDRHPARRLGPVASRTQLLANTRPRRLEVGAGGRYIQPAHARRSTVGTHSLPRTLQVVSCKDPPEQALPRVCRTPSRASRFTAGRRAHGFTAPAPTRLASRQASDAM